MFNPILKSKSFLIVQIKIIYSRMVNSFDQRTIKIKAYDVRLMSAGHGRYEL